MKIADLHVHSNYSDGSNNLKELINIISKNNINTFALTDHDTIDGNLELEKIVPNNINFIKGVELTCFAENIKCHILGYKINPNNMELKNLIEKGKKLRQKKLETRIIYLKEKHNIELTKEELNWLYSRRSVVKTHLANLLVKRNLAKNNVDAMKKYLDACPTGNTRFEGKEAIRTINFAGGIAIWAHPLGGEGEQHLSQKEFLAKLEQIKTQGIQGLECYYSRYNKEEIEFLVDCANKNNLLITGGSDYHGTNKDIPIGKLNVDNIPINSEKLTVLNYIL